MSTSSKKTERSKKSIKEALLSLLYEKDFNSITVNDLLVTANISRGTFYTHFSNLADVRQHIINDLYASADEAFGGYTASMIYHDPTPIIEIATKLKSKGPSEAKQLVKYLSIPDICINLTNWIVKFILSDCELMEKINDESFALIFTRFVAGGITYAFIQWVTDDFDGDPEELFKSLSVLLSDGMTGIVNK